MAEDRIDSIINVAKIEQELKDTTSGIKDLVALIKSVKDKSVQVSAAASIAEYRKLRTELDFLTKQTELATKAAINEAKVREANAKATVAETKATEAATKAKEKETAATNKQIEASNKAAAKKQEEARPYRQLALAFAAAAKEAQDLAAKYGTMDKRSQAAAKRANELNNELKKIDASIGNHQRNVGNYSSAFDKVGTSVSRLATNFLSLIGVVGVGSLFSSSIDEFVQMDKNVRQLQNTLKNLGVPEAFDRMSASADRLQKQFSYLDNDDILKSFQQILVYGKLTEQQINDLLPVIINYAADSGKSITDATEDIIKGLDGGKRAFKLYGLEVKETNTATENLSVIMDDLAPKVNNAGKAFAESAAGGLATARQEFKDIKEEIGSGLIPIINKLLSTLIAGVKNIGVFGRALKEVFSGGTGFFEVFTRGGANENVVSQLVEQYTSTYENVQKEIEKSLGRKLTKSKEDQSLLKSVQDQILEKRLSDIKVAEARLSELKKDFNINSESQKTEVRSLLSSIEANKQFLASVSANKSSGVLGVGSPDGNKDAGKSAKDAAKKAAELAERKRKAEFEAAKALQEEQVKIQEEIFKDETKSFDERINALRMFIQEKARLIELEREFEKGAKGLLKEEIAAIEADKQTDINELLRTGHAEYNKILEGQSKEEQRLHKENADRIKKIHEDLQSDIEKGLKEASERLKEELKKREEYEKTAADLRRELVNELTGLAFDALTASIEREKNAIQDSIDLLERKKQKDIEVANATITNAQDRAAAITVIEARAAAEREQLERKQRELNVKKAQFEKAEAIASIIQETAKAVVSLIEFPPLAVLAAAIGAAQLARVIATPIPRYKHGGTHKGGLMIVGDGGKSEGIELPDGTVLRSPSTPTLMDAPRDTKIHPDFSKMMLKATVTNVPVFKETTRSDTATPQVIAGLKSVEKAIRKIPQPHIQVQNVISRRIRSGNNNTTIIGNA